MAASCIILRLPGNGTQPKWGERLLAGTDDFFHGHLPPSCELPGLDWGWSPQGGLRDSLNF